MPRATANQPGAPTPASHPLASRAVVGLDAGRQAADRDRRRRRVRNRIAVTVSSLVALGVVGGAAWLGYQIYVEEQDREARERELRGGERTQMDIDDAIEELETSPKWNGPGNPAFGVGSDEP